MAPNMITCVCLKFGICRYPDVVTECPAKMSALMKRNRDEHFYLLCQISLPSISGFDSSSFQAVSHFISPDHLRPIQRWKALYVSVHTEEIRSLAPLRQLKSGSTRPPRLGILISFSTTSPFKTLAGDSKM